MKHLTSRDNPRVKLLRKLVADVSKQRKEGLTIADGPHLIRACIEHAYPINTIVVSEAGLRLPEIEGLIEATVGTECLLVPESIFRELSGTVSPVGILAVIQIPPAVIWQETLSMTSNWVVLDSIQDAGNLGSILRSAAAFGLENIVLGKGCAAAWSPKVIRAAQGAHFSLSLYEVVDLLDAIRGYRGKSIAMVLDGEILRPSSLSGGPYAWVFGNEGRGISPELISLCTERISIPMAKGTESLNVAAAAAICFFNAYSCML